MNLETRLNSLNLGINLTNELNISSLLFADDLLIISETEDNMQRLLMELQSWCTDFKMVVSETKSKVLSPSDLGFWELFDMDLDYVSSLEQVDFCKYLGVNMYPTFKGIRMNKNKLAISRAWSFAKSIMSNLKYDIDKVDVIIASWKNIALPLQPFFMALKLYQYRQIQYVSSRRYRQRLANSPYK